MCKSCKVKSCLGVPPVKSKLIIVPEPEETSVWQCGCADDGFNDWAKCDACPAINCTDCMCDVMRWKYSTLKSGKKSTKKGEPAYDGEKADYYDLDRGGDYDGKQDHEGVMCRSCFVERFGEEAIFAL